MPRSDHTSDDLLAGLQVYCSLSIYAAFVKHAAFLGLHVTLLLAWLILLAATLICALSPSTCFAPIRFALTCIVSTCPT